MVAGALEADLVGVRIFLAVNIKFIMIIIICNIPLSSQL